MLFQRPSQPRGEYLQSLLRPVSWSLCDAPLAVVASYKYLGVWLHQSLDWSVHLRLSTESLAQSDSMLGCLTEFNGGAAPSLPFERCSWAASINSEVATPLADMKFLPALPPLPSSAPLAEQQGAPAAPMLHPPRPALLS